MRIALTPGEPAGIGPDLAVLLAQQAPDCEIVAVADPDLLARRAAQLKLPFAADPVDFDRPWRAGRFALAPVALAAPCEPGRPDPANARYVLETLEQAVALCERGDCDALVTGPVHKAVINRAGIPFSGHTGFLAERTAAPHVVMLLVARGLRVALATVHIPLSEVPAAVTAESLDATLTVLDRDLRTRFGIDPPRILVAGLNPHAGEDGYLGREEIDTIAPALERARARGLDVIGPLPADTLFTPDRLADADAVLAMYHDQGLPVLKHVGFGHAVNVTLGLPIVRTSVDHGTALRLAGTGRADPGSMRAAVALARELKTKDERHRS